MPNIPKIKIGNITYDVKDSALTNHVNAITDTQKNLFWVTDTSDRTVNGVALKFNSDGSITAKGTATGLVVIYLRGATSNAANLTAGTYTVTRWTKVGSGNVRVTNNGSNILSSANVGKVSIMQTFTSDPHLYLTIGNSSQIDGTFYFQIEQGSTSTEYELGSKMSALDTVARFDAKKIEKNQTIRYRYTTTTATQGGTDRVQILIGDVRYDLVHSIDNSNYCDCWRMLSACVSDEHFSFLESITTSGEWECAVHLQNREDFSGGYLHGDEIMTAIAWFVDDAEISNIATKTSIEKASVIRVVETSNLYDPADHMTVIAEHGKEYVFDASGLTINQSIKWKVNASLERCYLAMYPASKSNTNELYCNSEFVRHALNETNYAHEIPKATETVIRGDHLTATFSVPVYPSGLTGGDVMYYGDNGGNSYNKCYYRVCNAGSANIGDIWVTKTKYDIRYH